MGGRKCQQTQRGSRPLPVVWTRVCHASLVCRCIILGESPTRREKRANITDGKSKRAHDGAKRTHLFAITLKFVHLHFLRGLVVILTLPPLALLLETLASEY